MRPNLIVGLGTAGCAAALHFRRLCHAELRALRRALKRANSAARTSIERRIREISGVLRVLAIDLDGTESYRLPPPLDPEDSHWITGESYKVSLHAGEVVDALRLMTLDLSNSYTVRPGCPGCDRN